MQKERERLKGSFLTLYRLTEGNIPEDYISIFSHSYSDGGECWLDMFSKTVGFERSQVADVVDFLSFINPKFFPPKETIESIDWSKLAGGKGRKCTKGIKVF